MNKFGIMQGRLTNKEGFLPQEFPWENWKEEFNLSQLLGIQSIEWMFNSEKYYDNPIYKEESLNEIKKMIIEKKVIIESICANYFMQNSLFDKDVDNRRTNGAVLQRLLCISNELNIKCIVLPLFEENYPKNLDEERLLAQEIGSAFMKNDKIQTNIAIESDWKAEKISSFIDTCNSNKVKVCYDLGNAVGAGYNVIEDIYLLKDLIVNVHIKDKKVSGKSILLGDGNVNFENSFESLKNINYTGNYILESYFGSDAIGDTKKNYFYVKKIYDILNNLV